MFTVCPKCALTLVVTAADLRVAQGYVRCGRCSSVFNALAQLSDDRGLRGGEAAPPEPAPEAQEPAAEETPAPPRRSAAQTAPPPAPDEEAVSEDALEFNPETTDAASVFVAASPSAEWTAATGSFKALVAANQEPVAPPGSPGAGEVDVELDAALLSDIVASGPAAVPQSAAPATPPGTGVSTQRRPPVAAPGHVERAPAQPLEAPPEEEEGLLAPPEPASERRPVRGVLWSVSAGLLALVLLAQIINHQRDALATDPRFNRPLTALYSALGVTLLPRWDLRAYDVRQLGAIVEQGSAGAITVRASIRNGGERPQPLPLLRVTLQDRFGNRLASRDVQPRDYLPRSVAPTALLSRDQRIDAELAFVDPGANAVGFELDACLPVSGGVACANDPSGH